MDHPKFDSAVERDEKGLKTGISPLYLTYFMLDWTGIAQAPADIECMTCAGQMVKAEPVRDKKGAVFDGIVCHHCKAVIWSRHVI
jgi:hypothetical protein